MMDALVIVASIYGFGLLVVGACSVDGDFNPALAMVWPIWLSKMAFDATRELFPSSHCKVCSRKLRSGAKFCGKCGTRVV